MPGRRRRTQQSLAPILLGVLLGVASAEEPRRDACGDPLPPHAVARLGTVRFRHPDCARTIAFSPDGKHLASVGRGDTMRIWEVPSGKEVLRTEGGGDDEALAWSGDGKWIAVETFRSGIEIREALTGKQVGGLDEGHNACAIALSTNGEVCAATTFVGRVLAWNTTAGKVLLEASVYGSNERPSLALSPDGSRLWTFMEGQKPRLWDLAKGQEVATPPFDPERAVLGAFSEDGKALAFANPDGTVRLVVEGGPPVRLGVVEWGLSSVRFLGDGKTLAVVASSGVQKRWIVADRSEVSAPALKDYRRHAREIGLPPSIVISRDGRYVASSGVAITLWDASTGEPLSPGEGPSDESTSVLPSPDGKCVAVGHEDGSVELWDLSTCTRVGEYRFTEEYSYPDVLAFSRGEGTLIVNGREGSVAVLHVPDLAPVRVITDVPEDDIALVSGGRMAVVGAYDDALSVVDLRDGSRSRRGEGRDEYCSSFGCVAVSPDERLLAWSTVPISNKGGIGLTLHSAETGRKVREFPTGINWSSSFWFTPDGTGLVIDGGESGHWQLWYVDSGEVEDLEETDCLTSGGRAAYAFDEKDALVVRSASDASVLWKADPDCGRCCASAVSANGRLLFTAMQDSTILVWELPPEALDPDLGQPK